MDHTAKKKHQDSQSPGQEQMKNQYHICEKYGLPNPLAGLFSLEGHFKTAPDFHSLSKREDTSAFLPRRMM